MSLEIKFKSIIHDEYVNLLNKDIYEKVLLDIMNKSKIVFEKQYIHQESQSNGESDYKTEDDTEFIDAKILFYNEQCIALKQGKIYEFLDKIACEINELYDLIMNGNYTSIKETILYKEINERFNKIKENEDVILFIPFDFTNELEKSLTSYFWSDIFSYTLSHLKKDRKDFFEKHKIYLVYPNIENKIVLKSIKNNEKKIEFLKTNILKKYIEVISVKSVQTNFES